ncbi:MAG: hypothetical protein LUF78_10755, partial [Clostridiales bacterium]|nr:hypothetical protein [Clostridiales bacterium]
MATAESVIAHVASMQASAETAKSRLQCLTEKLSKITNLENADLMTHANALLKNSKEWVRPTEWPDLDLLDLSEFEGVYATYVVNESGLKFLSMYGGGTLTIEEISIGEDGTVTTIQELTPMVTDGINELDLSDLEKGYHTFRITGFVDGFYLDNKQQRCLELYVRLPDFVQTFNEYEYLSTYIVQHVKIIGLTCAYVGDYATAFYTIPQLRLLELEDFFTAGSTTMSCMFWEGPSLTSLDLSSF